MNFDFSILKKLWDLAHEKLKNKKVGMFMDVSHTLEMAICVVNQLKNDSYC